MYLEAGQKWTDVEMADLNSGSLYICGGRTEVGQGVEMADLNLEVCTSVGAGRKWDRVEMADLGLEVCTSVGAGQKWDRVEVADLNSGSLYISGGGTEVGQSVEMAELDSGSVHLWGQDKSGREWRWLT